jgi:hypothetical protein
MHEEIQNGNFSSRPSQFENSSLWYWRACLLSLTFYCTGKEGVGTRLFPSKYCGKFGVAEIEGKHEISLSKKAKAGQADTCPACAAVN